VGWGGKKKNSVKGKRLQCGEEEEEQCEKEEVGEEGCDIKKWRMLHMKAAATGE
jgi:hypothetical protein